MIGTPAVALSVSAAGACSLRPVGERQPVLDRRWVKRQGFGWDTTPSVQLPAQAWLQPHRVTIWPPQATPLVADLLRNVVHATVGLVILADGIGSEIADLLATV